MSKFVVVILSREDKACEAVQAMRDLHDDGSISLYGYAVIAKSLDGNIRIKKPADAGPLGAAVGTIVGGLTGVFGGPVVEEPGVDGGAMIGGLGRLFNLGLGSAFVEQASRELIPGTIAIVAEVDESWEHPLDTHMAPLDATVLRSWRTDFEDDRVSADVTRWRTEVESLKAELEIAAQMAQSNLATRLSHARDEVMAAEIRASAQVDAMNRELKAKIATLQRQFASRRHILHDRLDLRIAALRASYQTRSGKLGNAWDEAREDVAA